MQDKSEPQFITFDCEECQFCGELCTNPLEASLCMHESCFHKAEKIMAENAAEFLRQLYPPKGAI